MINVKEFMQNNNIIILAEIDVKDNMFHIHKINKELKSYDLFEQIILFSNVDNLLQSTTGQLLPRIWTQGDSKCVICRPNEEKIVCVFYDTQMDAKDHYFYAKRLCDELGIVFNRYHQGAISINK